MADSPGGQEIGRISVKVVPDTSTFAVDVKTDLDKLKIEFTVPIQIDNTDLDAKARAAVDEAQEAAGSINIKTDIDTSQLSELDQGLSNADTSSEGLLSNLGLLPALIGLAVVAAAAIAPALALGIPVLIGLGAAVGVIFLSLKSLESVFKPILTGIDSLKKPISDLLTVGLAPLVKTFTTNLLPVLKSGLSGVATITNSLIKGFLALGSSTAFLKDLGALISGASRAFQPLAAVLPTVVKAFLQIGVAALPALVLLTKDFAGVLTNFATAISKMAASGQLTKIINGAADALKSIAGFGANAFVGLLKAGAGLAPLFVTIADALSSFLSFLGPVVSKLQPFTDALAHNKVLLAGFAIGLAALIGPFAAVAAAIVLLAVNFGKVESFFAPLAPTFAKIVVFLAPTIAAFKSLGSSIENLFSVVAPIFAQIFAIVKADFPQMKVIVGQAFSTIQSIVVAVLTVITTVIKVATAAISFVWKHWGADILATIKTVLGAVLTVIKGVLNIVQGVFKLFTDVLKGNWSGAWADIKQIVSGAWQVIEGVFRAAVGIIKGIFSGLITALGLIFKPLGHAIVAAIGDIGHLFEVIGKDIIDGIKKGVEDAASGLADAVVGAAKGALDKVGHFIEHGSPSELFAREVGVPIVTGIAMGVDRGASTVSESLIAAVNPAGATSPFGGSGGAAGRQVIINGNVGWDPDEVAAAIDQRDRQSALIYGLAGI